MWSSRGARARTGRNRGEGAVSYLASLLLAGALIAGVTVTPLASTVSGGIDTAICKVLEAGKLRTCTPAEEDDLGASPLPSDGPAPKPTPEDEKFQPARCIISTDTTKTKTVMRILFIKISASDEVKLTQWSDGTITLDYTGTAAGGVEGGLDIPGLKSWNGSASLTGSYTQGSGGGGRWLFDKHKTGDPQKDLELNHKDAQQFVDYLKGAAKCNSAPPRAWGTELGMLCHNDNKKNLPPLPPDRQPDLDLTRTTKEASGDLKFGGSVTNGGKTVLSGAGKGLQGTVTDDVLVMRGGGEITFVYTMEIGGKMGAGYQAEGSYMKQVYVTYNAEEYDRQKKEGKPHRPTKLRLTTSQRGADGNPGVDLKGTVPVGPINIQIEGGGGKTDTKVHTEVAEIDLQDPADSKIVEDWLNDGGSDTLGMPTPRDLTKPLPINPSPFFKLLHDKAKISTLDYNVNIDWWKAAFAIGLGTSLGKWSTGFKLFGLEISKEHENQTLTGDPLYAGAPREDGSRPWLPFTNCTKVKPVS